MDARWIWVGLYAASVLVANLTLNRFYDVGWLGQLSLGTVFFAAVFTLRDRLHTYGLQTVFIAIGLAVVVNVVAAWQLGTPVRFILASFVAILASELADTVVYQRLIARTWITRALASNAVSVPLDSILFGLLAFYGSMGHSEVAQIIWADIVFKTLIAGALALVLMHGVRARSSLATS